VEHKRKLGEILLGSSYIDAPELEFALRTQPEEMRIGEYLVKRGVLSKKICTRRSACSRACHLAGWSPTPSPGTWPGRCHAS